MTTVKSAHLGGTGLVISEVALGTMTWSRDTDDGSAAEMLRMFLDAGGTLVDTSCTYAGGGAEILLGELLRTEVSRDDILLATKAGIRTTSTGGVVDASRGTLLQNLDTSLARLGTDYVDLWLVGTLDPRTPIDETLSALTYAVSSGRARYAGLSNYPGWATAYAASLARAQGWPLAAVEVEYSLLERGIEREVVPAAAALGLGVLAWAALGRGVLTGKYRRTVPADSRAASPHLAGFVQPYLDDRAAAIVEAVVVAAEGLDCQPLDVALAWVRTLADSAIVGPRNPAQLRAILAGIEVEIPDELWDALDEVSRPAIGYPERR